MFLRSPTDEPNDDCGPSLCVRQEIEGVVQLCVARSNADPREKTLGRHEFKIIGVSDVAFTCPFPKKAFQELLAKINTTFHDHKDLAKFLPDRAI